MVTEVRGICKSPAPSFSPPWRRQSTWNDGWKRFLEICGDGRGPWSSSSAVAARALKLLHAEGDSVITEFNYLLRHLVWLRLDDCRDANALSQLCVPNLRVVELFDVDCNLNTLLQGQNQVPTQLRELYVRSKTFYGGSKISRFTELPKSIGLLRNLEKIILYANMTTLPDELCQLLCLNYLDLSHCQNLQWLPSGFGNLRNLRHLYLSDCRGLQWLPSGFGNLRNLRHLDLSGCRGLQALPNSFSQLIQLQYLSLRGCLRLMVSTDILRYIVTLQYLYLTSIQETLPTHITNQRLLRNLYVDCPHLKELPVDMDYLCNLRVLEVTTATMTALPSSLTSLTSLKSLNLSSCRRLQCLPESIAQLQALEYLNLDVTSIQVLPQGVAHLRSLVELKVQFSPLGVIMLSNPRDEKRSSCLGNPVPVDSLTKAMIRLQSIYLRYTKTTKLCITTDVCPNLETLQIAHCNCLIKVEALPITLVNIVFDSCKRLKKVEGFQNLTRLRNFDISGCSELQELVDLSESKSLELLKADGCCMLTKMQGLQQLQQLRELQIAACTAGVWTGIKCLKELPSKVCSITLNMQTVGAEEIHVYEILNSSRFPISVFDFKFGAVCKVEPSEVRSCSGVIIIHLCETRKSWGEHGDDYFLTMGPYEDNYYSPTGPFTTVHVSLKSECQFIILSFYAQGSRFLRELKEFKFENNMLLCDTSFTKKKSWVVLLKDKEEEIWEKLFSYASSMKAFKDGGHNCK